MGKDDVLFADTPGYGELDADEYELQKRRIATYSKEALKMGQRLDAIFVLHPQFKAALRACDRIFQISREFSTPQGMCLVGPSGSGKSSVFRYFRESLPKSTLFAPGWGCIGIRAYEQATTGHMVAALLRNYKYPFTRFSEKSVYLRRGLVFELIRQKGTRLIFIDSAHHLLAPTRSGARDPTANDFIVEMMDETQVGVVLAGNETLGRQEAMSRELSSRVTVRNELQDFASNTQWEGFLKAFVNTCTWLDLKLILSAGQPKMLHQASEGNLRSLKRLLTEAAMICAQEGRPVIEINHLWRAFECVNGNNARKINPYVAASTVSVDSAAARG